MAQKPIAISVIVPLTVAGILTLSLLAAISSTNQAFAQAKPTTLSLGTYPCCKLNGPGPRSAGFFGNLLSEGSGVEGSTITFTGVQHSAVTTGSDGGYSIHVSLDTGTHKITAHFAGDSDHESSSTTKTITVCPGAVSYQGSVSTC
ncbi:MAG: hypothetical protein WBZ36_14720 [Candidatus Nitrosopolaris sp.]